MYITSNYLAKHSTTFPEKVDLLNSYSHHF